MVIGKSGTGKEYPWHRAMSSRFGEGGVLGKSLLVEAHEDPARRRSMRIPRDFGLSVPGGEDVWRTCEALGAVKIPDFSKTVPTVSLSFHGHEAAYRDDVLQTVEIPGGSKGFGDIRMGMNAEEAG